MLELRPSRRNSRRSTASPGSPATARSSISARWSAVAPGGARCGPRRSEEHTSELQSLMRISYAVFCLKKKKKETKHNKKQKRIEEINNEGQDKIQKSNTKETQQTQT